MKVIGHRGAPKEALENSFTAFDLAVEAGADRIELDVHLTSDRSLVIIHDYNLRRTTGRDLELADLSREQLAEIPLLNGDPIPFLDEVLERYLPKIELNIELKGHAYELGHQAARLVKANPYREKVIFSSFHPDPLRGARDHSDIAVACLVASPLSWPIAAHSSPVNFMNELGATIIHPCARLLNDNFMDQAKQRNWIVNSYSELLNSQEETDAEGLWTAMITWGVDGHCTNYPRQLRQWINTIDAKEFVHKEAFRSMEP